MVRTTLSTLSPDIGSQIHVGSAIFFTIMVWFRFYYAEKSRKKMIKSCSKLYSQLSICQGIDGVRRKGWKTFKRQTFSFESNYKNKKH